jgi:hypothetical protein
MPIRQLRRHPHLPQLLVPGYRSGSRCILRWRIRNVFHLDFVGVTAHGRHRY